MTFPPSNVKRLPGLGLGVKRRQVLAPLTALLLNVPLGAVAQPESIKLGGDEYTPAAMILQMAEQTAAMEGIMRASAKPTPATHSISTALNAGELIL